VGLAKKLGEAEMATYAKTKNIQPMEAKVQALIQEDSSISQAMAKHNAALRNQGKDPASPVARISLLASVIGQYTIESQVKKATGGTDGNPIRWCKEHPAPAAPRR
jgi:hypothetical protein